jgi:CubicO group peptidase (beta-lactamase class C family)
LSGGLWQGKRLIPAAWIAASTTEKISWPRRDENVGAGRDGYAWHLDELKSGDKTYNAYEANGNGGQLLIVIPELDLAVVFTAANYAHGGAWHWFRDNWLVNVIIPGVIAGS